MQEIYLINVTGKDRPGLTSQLSEILAVHDANILDIGQAVIHDYLSLGLLVAIPEVHASSSLLKDVLFWGHGLDLHVHFTPVDLEQYEAWVREQGKERRVITMLGRGLTGRQIAAVTAVIAEYNLNIDVITRLSGRISLTTLGLARSAPTTACIQYTVTGMLHEEGSFRSQLLVISQEMGVDVSFQIDDIYRRNRRLVAFDMDSTLIQTEVINELAELAGAGAEVAAITELAMRGELDFSQSLARRVALLAGLDEQVLAEVAARLPLTEGVENAIATLKDLGYKTAIISGGFDYFGEHLRTRLGIDYVHTNRLEIVGGKLTGRVVGEIVDGAKKAELLRAIAAKENLKLAQTIAVGDGANDLPMLSIAGLGIAFHAKPMVRAQAQSAISGVGMDGLLYLIGIREREFGQKKND